MLEGEAANGVAGGRVLGGLRREILQRGENFLESLVALPGSDFPFNFTDIKEFLHHNASQLRFTFLLFLEGGEREGKCVGVSVCLLYKFAVLLPSCLFLQ